MAHFYGSMTGSRGEATRCGTKQSGIDAHIRGWRYSLTTSQHQYGCLTVAGKYEYIDGEIKTIVPTRQIGRLHNNGTAANTFSKGKGRTPFSARVGY